MRKIKSKVKIKAKTKAKTKLPTKRAAPPQVFKVAPNILFRTMEGKGGISILDMNELESYYEVDSWAAEAWKLINGKNSVDFIINKIALKSGLETKTVKKETDALLKKLKKMKLIIDVTGK